MMQETSAKFRVVHRRPISAPNQLLPGPHLLLLQCQPTNPTLTCPTRSIPCTHPMQCHSPTSPILNRITTLILPLHIHREVHLIPNKVLLPLHIPNKEVILVIPITSITIPIPIRAILTILPDLHSGRLTLLPII